MTNPSSESSADPARAPTFSLDDPAQGMVVRIVGAVALAHLLNDLIQAVLPAIYPMLKSEFTLSFAQIGWIGLVYQITASLLQPWIGLYTDKHPKPYLLPAGMVVTLAGIVLLAISGSYPMLLVASTLIGVGSSTFHPEASRVARMASGGRFGTAQSAFQVGGNTGSAIGPLLAAVIIIPHGQSAIAWCMLAALLAIWVLCRVTGWTLRHGSMRAAGLRSGHGGGLPRALLVRGLTIVAILLFAKFVYVACLTNYFTFYLIERFDLSLRETQLYLFAFLAAIAVGTFAGGPLGDRIGRKAVIWISFLGAAPFALLLPYVDLFWTAVLASIVGLIISSAFAALVVYAQETVPGRVGMVSGVMFGFMFGISGIAAAGLGHLADVHGIIWIYQLCSYLPLLGLATIFLPTMKR